MEKTFDEKILLGAEKSVDKYLSWIEGDQVGSPTIKGAEKLITWAIKIRHLMMIDKNTKRSRELRLMGLLKNEKSRNQYIRLTNPELKAILINKPEKRKRQGLAGHGRARRGVGWQGKA